MSVNVEKTVISFEAKKLSLIMKLFYTYPKELLLFLYFKVLKNRKHIKFVIFENMLMDVAYVIKNHDKDRAAFDLQQLYTDGVGDNGFWQKDFYQKQNFHGKVIANYIERLKAQVKSKAPKRIVDIGCANGVRLDVLAKEFPNIEFIGLDFLVDQAVGCNIYSNVKYLKGYPLDTFKTLGDVDMVFSSQALLHALPKELCAYFEAFKKANVKYVSIFDTNCNGYLQKNDAKLWSKHMGYSTAWCHNYSGYFKQYGYAVTDFDVELCDFHPSRSDYYLVLIFGEYAGESVNALVDSHVLLDRNQIYG